LDVALDALSHDVSGKKTTVAKPQR
jgi:hypothetical protein